MRETAPTLREGLEAFAGQEWVRDVRAHGFLGAITFLPGPGGWADGELGQTLMDEAAEDGLLVRAIGDTIAFAPPLISTAEEVSMMVDVFMRTYQSVRSGVRPPAR